MTAPESGPLRAPRRSPPAGGRSLRPPARAFRIARWRRERQWGAIPGRRTDGRRNRVCSRIGPAVAFSQESRVLENGRPSVPSSLFQLVRNRSVVNMAGRFWEVRRGQGTRLEGAIPSGLQRTIRQVSPLEQSCLAPSSCRFERLHSGPQPSASSYHGREASERAPILEAANFTAGWSRRRPETRWLGYGPRAGGSPGGRLTGSDLAPGADLCRTLVRRQHSGGSIIWLQSASRFVGFPRALTKEGILTRNGQSSAAMTLARLIPHGRACRTLQAPSV